MNFTGSTNEFYLTENYVNATPTEQKPEPKAANSSSRYPRFTVITVVKNAVDVIEDCVSSIRIQDYPCEHIIVDGGSTDGTLRVLEQTVSKDALIISEPDDGMYDAMNKGLAFAGGDYIGILNADDVYAHKRVLSTTANFLVKWELDACYSDVVYVNNGKDKKIVRYWNSGEYNQERFLRGWMPPHPTFFVKRSTFEKHGKYRTELGTSADYELMLRLLLKFNISAAYLPGISVVMRSGGLSNASWGNRLRANRNDSIAWKINGLKPKPWTLFLKPLSKLMQFSPFILSKVPVIENQLK